MERQAVRLLVVDDEPFVRELLEMVLEGAGYDVSTAADGVEALSAIEATQPDLILLDLNMPRLNGFGVLESLRAAPPRKAPKIIVLTARNDPADLARCRDLGAADLLTKPFQNDLLLKHIARLAAN